MYTDMTKLAWFIGERRRRKYDVIVASGYFNCLHVGHLRYLEAAKRLWETGIAHNGATLVVVVNNDRQVELKGSRPFMNEQDRLSIVCSIRWVDHATIAIDDDRSICKTLEKLKPTIFVNGGDVRCEADCREAEVCHRLGIRMVFGVGGTDKMHSSSELLRRAVSPG